MRHRPSAGGRFPARDRIEPLLRGMDEEVVRELMDYWTRRLTERRGKDWT